MAIIEKTDPSVPSVGIRSLAVSFPRTIRTNDYWLDKLPQLGTQSISRQRIPRTVEFNSSDRGIDLWLQEVTPYLSDPFKGSVKRRVLASDESSLMLECHAAQEALKAAELSFDEVELAIVASLFPQDVGPGTATYLAQQLELRCPAWNLESTCASALIALQTAQAFIKSGVYRHILIVVSHIGSNTVNEADSLSWSMGDGAGAFVVGSLKPHQGILATKILPTTVTCGAYQHELVIDALGKPRLQTVTGENISTLAETAVDFVRQCCEEALREAEVSRDEIKCFVVNTPTAWYANVCAKALSIAPERIINLYPHYANIGPVFSVASLYHAVSTEKIEKNDLVLVYANGAAANAVAMVMRWGEVALGSSSFSSEEWKEPQPEKPIQITLSGLGGWKEKLLAANARERESILKTYLREWLANSQQLSAAEISEQEYLTNWLDSLMAIAFRSQIETDLQIRVPIETLLGQSTLWHLTEFLLNQLAVLELMAAETSSNPAEREIISF